MRDAFRAKQSRVHQNSPLKNVVGELSLTDNELLSNYAQTASAARTQRANAGQRERGRIKRCR